MSPSKPRPINNQKGRTVSLKFKTTFTADVFGLILGTVALIVVSSYPIYAADGFDATAEDRVLARYGILNRPAPELELDSWIDGSGKPISQIRLKALRGKVIYLYFFQDWCPGCHSHGFPTLQ